MQVCTDTDRFTCFIVGRTHMIQKIKNNTSCCTVICIQKQYVEVSKRKIFHYYYYYSIVDNHTSSLDKCPIRFSRLHFSHIPSLLISDEENESDTWLAKMIIILLKEMFSYQALLIDETTNLRESNHRSTIKTKRNKKVRRN